MLAADDLIFRTENWDEKVIKEFLKVPDRIVYVFTDDGFRGRGQEPEDERSFGTHGFIHKNWTDVLDYFTRPYFPRHGTDTWFNYIGNELGRKAGIQDVLIEHMHFRQGKSKCDQTYQDQIDHGHLHKQIWVEREGEMLEDIERLRKFIEEFDEGNSDKPT